MLHQKAFLQCFIIATILESLGELPKILDHRPLLTEVAIEIFLENSCTLYENRQFMLLNIVFLRNFQTQNVQAVHQRDFRNVRKAKQIKSTQVYDKW